MSSEATAALAGPSSSATQEKKTKRIRKRSRNKKRTTEVDSSSDSDSDDDTPAPAPVAVLATPSQPKPDTPSATSKPATAAAGSDAEDSDGDADDGEKRKRKRKRSSKKKSDPGPTASSTPAATATSTSATPASGKAFTLGAGEVGPDPATDVRLSEQAKQAIQYAQLYSAQRTQWKFNKAKQNWLLRNALSVPPADYDAELARKPAAAPADDAEDDEGDNFVPEDLVPVVTAYLSSVVGGARQRLVDALREALNAPVVTVPQAEADEAAKGADEAAEPPAEGAKKSVSFGNIALDSEKKDEAVQAAGLPAGTDPRAVELRRQRAKQMLERFGESV